MDRPLRRPADFERFLGHRVDVRMRLADATGRRRYVGVLRGIDGATATVEVDGAAVALQLEGMDRARLVPEL
jgi:ribosome maturation factor RimP